MQEIILIGAAAAVAGIVLGALLGAWIADRKLRRHYEEVRSEIFQLRAVAEEKLSGDDPNIDELLENLHSAVNGAYGAIQAMETQAAITRRKSEGSKELITASRHIIRMIDEYAGIETEPHVVEKKKAAPTITAKPAEKADQQPIQKALAKKKSAERSKE